MGLIPITESLLSGLYMVFQGEVLLAMCLISWGSNSVNILTPCSGCHCEVS